MLHSFQSIRLERRIKDLHFRFPGFCQDSKSQFQWLSRHDSAHQFCVKQQLFGRLVCLIGIPNASRRFEILNHKVSFCLQKQIHATEQVRDTWNELTTKFLLDSDDPAFRPNQFTVQKTLQHSSGKLLQRFGGFRRSQLNGGRLASLPAAAGKRPTNPFLSGSVVWIPVSSGFPIPPDEVVHEQVGAVVA
jgi:hypothetical protein